MSSDIDHLLSIVSLSSGPPKILLMLAVSSNDLLGGHSKSATDLASIRVASGRLKGSRMREFLRVSDLPEMADEDLVVTTDQNRHPKVFRPFQENWSS